MNVLGQNENRGAQKTNFVTRMQQLGIFLSTLLLLVSPTILSAQVDQCDELICNGDLQISLNISCELLLTPDMLLESPAPGDYTIQLFDHHGNYLRDSFLIASDAGETIKYQVSCGGNSCWGEIIVEANIVPQFDSPCAPRADGTIPNECTLWCGPVGKVPASLVTPEQVIEAFGNCGPNLLGDLRITETRNGEICSISGEEVLLVYSGKVILHGSIQNVDILTQKYTTKKLTVDENTFNFPGNVVLDCDYLDHIEQPEDEDPILYTLGEPASIYAFEHDKTLAYPYYINVHDTILDIQILRDSTPVVVSQMYRDTMVEERIDGVDLWVIKTIVDKVYELEYEHTEIVVGKINPIVPVVDRVCNVLSGYSDIEFDACGQGKKIVRTWNLIDWCDAKISLSDKQTIEIRDISVPHAVEKVDGKYVNLTMLDDISVSIDPWACSAKFSLPELLLMDNCDADPDVLWDTNEGYVSEGYLVDLWLGQSPVHVKGSIVDDCGNTSVVSFNVIIVDDVPPVPVCETSLQVSLTGNSGGDYGIAKVYAQDLDEGSHDSGCGKVKISVVRFEDWRQVKRDCRNEVVGFEPVSCSPITADVDLGEEAFKNNCDRNGNNISQVTVAGDYVQFCCQDLGQIIQVILLIEDEEGNVNQCMVGVEVVDKSAPTLLCEDKVISCADGEYLETPAMVGASCEREEPIEVLLLSESRANDVCAGGQTVREWYIDTDNSGDFSPGDAYCQQIVRVDADTSFDPYTIKWPKNFDGKSSDGFNIEVNDDGEVVEIPTTVSMGDAAACMPDNFGVAEEGDENADPSGVLGVPVWCDTECGLVGYSMEADTIKASDACLKIIRRWTIVDWCTFNPNGSNIDDENDTDSDSFEPIEDWAQFEADAPGCPTYAPNIGDAVYFRYTKVDKDGYYTYDQVIVVNDDTAPEIDGPASYTVNTTGGATTKDDPQDCVGEEIITASASDLCGGNMTGSELLQWQITVSKDGVIVASKTVRGPEASMSSQEGSPGDVHTITWTVKDGCGNATTAQTTVTFGDQQAPTPFCISGLATAFMASDGSVTVWGAEFDFGSFDNCTATEDLRFTIVQRGVEPIRPGQEGFEDQTGITFQCSEYSNYSDLDMWAWDAVGNGDFCRVGIIISDNGDVCAELEEGIGEEVEEEEEVGEENGAGVMIRGNVQTSYGMMINDVQVRANAAGLPEYPITQTTNDNGEYAFSGNPLDFNYELSADKVDDYMNGVSTLDLVMISRHIVEIESFEDPYKIIASDASVDGRVSAVDLSFLKRLVLGVVDELENTNAWVFIDADQNFFDQYNPWPFSNSIEINALSTDMLNENFIGVKIGDVNQSIQGVEARSSEVLQLNVVEEKTVMEGDIVSVDFSSSNFDAVSGYQFTLDHKGLTLESVSAGTLTVDESSIGAYDEQLTMSWFDAEAIHAAKDEVLFTLHFKANKTIDLNESLAINSDITQAEAYVGEDYDIHSIELTIESENTFSLSQNNPNPFNTNTLIEFRLPAAGSASLTVYDVTGKVLVTINKKFNKGYNNIELSSSDLNQSGVLYYQLDSGEYSHTKRMILLGQ